MPRGHLPLPDADEATSVLPTTPAPPAEAPQAAPTPPPAYDVAGYTPPPAWSASPESAAPAQQTLGSPAAPPPAAWPPAEQQAPWTPGEQQAPWTPASQPASTAYPSPYTVGAPASPTPPLQPPAARTPRSGDANPFSSLFDLSFTRFATPGLVKIVYVASIVVALGTWLLWVMMGFAAGSAFGGFRRSDPTPGVAALIFGWIPALLSIAFTRFVLEFFLATIRTNATLEKIAARLASEPDA